MATLSRIAFPTEPTTSFDIDAHADSVAAASGGDQFANGAGVMVAFWAKNTSGSPRTITFDAPKVCDHGFLHDEAIVVADGFEGIVKIGFDGARFNDSNDMVQVTYSSEVGLDVAALILPA